jgi:hypothetical protein
MGYLVNNIINNNDSIFRTASFCVFFRLIITKRFKSELSFQLFEYS